MTLFHNSRHIFCRTHFGAACCCSKVKLRLFAGDCGWPEYVGLEYSIDNGDTLSAQMHFHSVVAGMNVYEAELAMPENPALVRYWFAVWQGDMRVYYGNNAEQTGGIGAEYTESPKPYQITVYRSEYHTPDWFKRGVMYQIFPDRFAKSDAYDNLGMRGDIIKRQWGDMPYYKPSQFGGEYLSNDFFGGSIAGITEKLPYLADLGITIIYLNPIFEAYSNHKYDTGDYCKIDPMFGDEERFAHLCSAAAELGIRIILDGVFNHTGSDSIYFNKNGKYAETGAYQSVDSPYYDWYKFENHPDKYECWWGIKTLPHIDETQPSYMDHILRGGDAVVKKWLKAGASGWRLDVVDELPEEFVQTLRREVKGENPDAVIIGEVWEDASNKEAYGELRHYLGGDELDSAMNYPLRAALINFTLGNISGQEFYERVMCLCENYPKEAFFAMMNFLSSHDTLRILTAVSDAPNPAMMSKDAQAEISGSGDINPTAFRRLKLISEMQMYLPGAPCIYYGDEIGMQGYADPFCRQCFDWDKANGETNAWFKAAISARRESAAFVGGDFDMVYGEGRACGFVRYCADEVGEYEEFKLVMINADTEHSWFAWVELGRFGINELTFGDERMYSENGRFGITIPPCTVAVYDGK